ncbi:MAG: 1-phosphofructokinase family hexose kinase [Chloroflexi bacterium]|nr:1-phosphofructokinase family hexose kinase [Chloroflexota bacterium]MCC6896235.1 hexose kinase [Anaerolineae bacterium]
MIVTLTPNTTLDLTVLIPKFELNKTIRASQSLYGMAGKPTDASWVLAELGIPSHALGFGAGSIAHKIEAMLHSRGITTDFVPVGGESRVNMVIVCEDGSGQSTITTSSLDVSDQHIDRLLARFEGAVRNASCVVMGGSLPENVPPSFYADAIRLAKAYAVPVIFDAGEPNLSAGLAACPDFIKPNEDELSGLVGERVTDMPSAYRAGQRILEQYGTSSIMTFGGEGALAVLPERAYHIPALKIEVVSAAGAGDAVLAGLAASIERGQPVEDGLRLGFAAATAVCLMAGTAQCRSADVEAFLPQIELIPYRL